MDQRKEEGEEGRTKEGTGRGTSFLPQGIYTIVTGRAC